MPNADRDISTLYVELAFECFDTAGRTEDPGAAEALKRMGHHYYAQAVALNPVAVSRAIP